jgi:hypothetical protein
VSGPAAPRAPEFVAHDGEQPRLGRGTVAQPRERAPTAQQRFLHHVLGLRALAREPIGEAKEVIGMRTDGVLESH